MADQPSKGFDPQKPGGSQQPPAQQQGSVPQPGPGGTQPPTDPGDEGEGKISDQEDKELSQYLQDEHGHTKESADHEVKRDREGIRKRKRQHEEEHKHSKQQHGR